MIPSVTILRLGGEVGERLRKRTFDELLQVRA
jgi:hypothetical protein